MRFVGCLNTSWQRSALLMNIKKALCTTLTTICPELCLTHQPLHKHHPNASERANFINIFNKPCGEQQRLTVHRRKQERVPNLLSSSLADYYLSSLSKCQHQIFAGLMIVSSHSQHLFSLKGLLDFVVKCVFCNPLSSLLNIN